MLPDPTLSHTDSVHEPDATRRQRFGLAFALVLGGIAAGFSYLGTRDAWVVAERPPEATPVALSGEEADPAWDIELPAGPHRDEFQTSCLICHSARLPLGQPRFAREKWSEIVHKMVATYGAPLRPEHEAEVVEYLLTARPPRP